MFVRTQYQGRSSFKPVYLFLTDPNEHNFWHIDQPWPLLCPFISIQTLNPGVMCCDPFRNNNKTKNREVFKHTDLSISSYASPDDTLSFAVISLLKTLEGVARRGAGGQLTQPDPSFKASLYQLGEESFLHSLTSHSSPFYRLL